MFQNQRFMTRGIQAEIPLELQIFMWAAIDELRNIKPLDHLQVFKFRPAGNGKALQEVVHIQEQPPYSKLYLLNIETPITAKIFIIDSIEYATMLLASEY